MFDLWLKCIVLWYYEKSNGKGDSMKNNLYTYLDSKKIYLATTKEKYLLIEKKSSKEQEKSISLISRNIKITDKENGLLLFPKK